MRGLLAVIVMLYHYGLNTVINRVVPVGHAQWTVCVDFFFVLSGFVLCRSILASNPTVGAFAWRRFGRLFPLHLTILLLFSAVLYAEGRPPGGLLGDVLATGPLTHGKITNGVAWSLSFEFYLPVAFVALVGWWRNWSAVVTGVACAVFALALAATSTVIFIGDVDPLSPAMQWARAVAGIGLGFGCWLWLSRADPLKGFTHPLLLPLCCAAFCGIILFGTVLPLLGLLVPLVIVATLCVGKSSSSLFSSLPAQRLGHLSFAIYMIHGPVMQVFLAWFGEDALKSSIMLKGMMVLLSVLGALILHLAVEKPMMWWFRRPPPWLSHRA